MVTESLLQPLLRYCHKLTIYVSYAINLWHFDAWVNYLAMQDVVIIIGTVLENKGQSASLCRSLKLFITQPPMNKKRQKTERGGSVVMHETRFREVPGSNPGADQPDWGFFVVFLNHKDKCWVEFSLPRSIWPLFIKFIYHKIKSVNLTNERLTIQQ